MIISKKHILTQDALSHDYPAISFIVGRHLEKHSKNLLYSTINYVVFSHLNTIGTMTSKERHYVDNTASHPITIYNHKDYILAKYSGDYIIFYEDTEHSYYRKYLMDLRNSLMAKSNISLVQRMKNRLDNIIMNDNVRKQIYNFVDNYFGTYELRRQLNQTKRASIILCGKPGDGKTWLADQLLKTIELSAGLASVKDSDIVFQKAAKMTGHFCGFLDDLNQSHLSRTGPHADICSNILSEMDRPNCNRIFVITTNQRINKGLIDPAFFRPGRIEHIIEFGRPCVSARYDFFNNSFNETISKILKVEVPNGFIEALVEKSEDFSFAQLNGVKDILYSNILNGLGFDIKDAVNKLSEVDQFLEESSTSNTTTYMEEE